jgi:hypothetical protein
VATPIFDELLREFRAGPAADDRAGDHRKDDEDARQRD